jgi:hypothetical protein
MAEGATAVARDFVELGVIVRNLSPGDNLSSGDNLSPGDNLSRGSGRGRDAKHQG